MPVNPDPSPANACAVTVPSTSTSSPILTTEELSALIMPVRMRLSSITMPVESSDLIMLATRSPLITMSPVPFGSMIMSEFVKVELMMLPEISIDFPVES